jgi:ubiquinone/menaquinone biosynthesis C-methylase UbiE
MKDLKESVIESLDGTSQDLFPYFPYLLQDLQEMGTDSKVVSRLVKKNIDDSNPLKILDLGCGKGAVSVRLAKDFNCKVIGIDAIHEFVESAKQLAVDEGIDNKTKFIQGDIRLLYTDYKNYDIVVLGAIGPVLGNQQETLEKITQCLKPHGFVILDDGYLLDKNDNNNDIYTTQKRFYQFIKSAGFMVVEEYIFEPEKMHQQNELIFNAIKKRAKELIEKYPSKASIFKDYLIEQETENYALENDLTCGVWLLRLK